MFTFAFATEITLAHLDLFAEHSLALSLQFVDNNLAQTMKIVGGGIAVNPTKPRRCSHLGSGSELLN